MKNKIKILYDGIQLQLTDSLTKVFWDERPKAMAEEAAVQALRGECVSFQLAYSFEGWRFGEGRVQSFRFAKVKVESPVLPYLQVRKVMNVPSRYAAHKKNDDNYLRREPGLYPDLLETLEDDCVVFQEDQWNSLWIDLEAPADAAPGTYPVCITFTDAQEADGQILACVETEVTVLAPKLQEQKLIRTEWFYVDCLADYYHVPVFSEEHWKIIEHFVATAAHRGINMILTPQFTPPLDTAVGKERTTVQLVKVEKTADSYAFDFTDLERWIVMCKKNGIRYFEMSHLFSQWGAVAAPKIVGMVDGAEQVLFGWDTPAAGGEYEKFLRIYLPQLKQKLEELGVLEEAYFHISDEPNLNQIDSYRAASKIVQKELAGCKFLEALSDYEFYQTGLVSRPVCGSNHIQPFLEKQTPGLWAYYCTAQGVDVSNRFMAMSLGRTRMIGVQLYKFDIEGMLHWGYNFYNGVDSLCKIDPYRVTDACGAYPSGDPFIVYPGEGGYPKESIRMMALEEAMNDVRALQMLESFIGRAQVLALIEEDLEQPLEFDRFPAWPEDAAYLINLRAKVNAKLCACAGSKATCK